MVECITLRWLAMPMENLFIYSFIDDDVIDFSSDVIYAFLGVRRAKTFFNMEL